MLAINNLINALVLNSCNSNLTRLIVGPDYDIIPLARPGTKIESRRFFEIESLKLV